MKKRKPRKPETLIRKALVSVGSAQFYGTREMWVESNAHLNRIRALLRELRASLRAGADGKGRP